MRELKTILGILVITIIAVSFLSWSNYRDDKVLQATEGCSMVETLQGQEVICQ